MATRVKSANFWRVATSATLSTRGSTRLAFVEDENTTWVHEAGSALDESDSVISTPTGQWHLIGGSGGEGGSTSETSLGTIDTGNIASSGGTADLNFALPSGVTSCLITRIEVERTAGTGTSCTVAAYTEDDRSDAARYLMGTGFSGQTVDPGPVLGPLIDSGGTVLFFPVQYVNVDDSEFLRITVTNQDFSNDATYDVTIHVLAL